MRNYVLSLQEAFAIARLATLAFLMSACGVERQQTSCTIDANDDGTETVSCSDGKSVTIGAKDGTCTIHDNDDSTKTVSCSDGNSVTIAAADGTCAIHDNDDGTKTISCSDGNSVTTAAADGTCTIHDNDDGTKTISCSDGNGVNVGGSLPYVDVRAFGARGDGSDDTAAIQAALDACTGALRFNAGTYVITGAFVPSTCRWVFGDGPYSTNLKRKNSSLTFELANTPQPTSATNNYDLLASYNHPGLTLENLTVDGNWQNQPIMSDLRYREGASAGAAGNLQNIYFVGNSLATNQANEGKIVIRNLRSINSVGNGIVVNNWNDVQIDSVYIDNAGKNCIYLARNHCFNSFVTNSVLRNCGFIYGGGIGIADQRATIIGNRLYGNFEYGIGILPTGNGEQPPSDIVIQGNVIRHVRGPKLAMTTSTIAVTQDGVPDAINHLTDFQRPDIGSGIVYVQNVWPGDQKLNLQISNNTISGAYAAGISVQIPLSGTLLGSPAWQPSGVVADGNIIYLNGSAGLDLRQIRNFVVDGNLSYGNQQNAGFANGYFNNLRSGLVSSNLFTRRYLNVDMVKYGNPTRRYEARATHFSEVTTAPNRTFDRVIGFVVTSGGTGYSSSPTVTFSSPPSGVTAAGTAIVQNQQVVGVALTNSGSGYVVAPTLSFSGGGGTGAAGLAYLSYWEDVTDTKKFPIMVVVAAGGTGYAPNDLLTVGGGTASTSAALRVTGVSSGAVTSVAVETPGAYSAKPANPVLVSGGSGADAQFTLTWIDDVGTYGGYVPQWHEDEMYGAYGSGVGAATSYQIYSAYYDGTTFVAGADPSVRFLGNDVGDVPAPGFIADFNLSRTFYASMAPTSGYYQLGDRVINSAPSLGQPKSWVCTNVGTAPTWTPTFTSEGNL